MARTLTASELAEAGAPPVQILRVLTPHEWTDALVERHRKEYVASLEPRAVLRLRLKNAVREGNPSLLFAAFMFMFGTIAMPTSDGSELWTAGWTIAAVIFFGICLYGLWDAWKEMRDAFQQQPQWQTSSVHGKRYSRDWRYAKLPPLARELVGQIRSTLPDARFEVEFLGFDPILWCYPDGSHGDRTAALVWEGEGRKAVAVVPPTSTN